MSTAQRLIRASKAVTSMAEVRFIGIPDREDWVVCRVMAGGLILVESAAGPVEDVMLDVVAKLEGLSQRILRAATEED